MQTGMLRAIEKITGNELTQAEMKQLAHGPDESDLVNSGLEDTMIVAYNDIRDTQKRNREEVDLRTASFINAINTIATHYMELGIFP